MLHCILYFIYITPYIAFYDVLYSAFYVAFYVAFDIAFYTAFDIAICITFDIAFYVTFQLTLTFKQHSLYSNGRLLQRYTKCVIVECSKTKTLLEWTITPAIYKMRDRGVF